MASIRLLGTRGSSLALYASPRNSGGSSSLFSMPWRPAAMVAANARDGVAAAPGIRHSTRRLGPCPMMREAAARLSQVQTLQDGADHVARLPLSAVTSGAENMGACL